MEMIHLILLLIIQIKRIVWYENNHPTWTRHIISANTDNTDFILVADFDNDDTLDVVTAGDYSYGGDVVWYENNHPIWNKHIIESGSSEYPSLAVADIDDDGFLDIAATMSTENKVVWFRNENGGLSWTKHSIDNNLPKAWGINSSDINGDNKIDIIATGQNANSVAWYENSYPSWTKHLIDADLIGANWVDAADVNGDDKIDVIASGFSADDVVWYENNLHNWNKNIIDSNLDAPRVFAITDIDGDNTNDLVVPAQSSIVWYKNPYTTVAYGKSMEVYPKYIRPEGDTLLINAHLSNPEEHQVTVYAKISGDEETFLDSIELFDDGLHRDDKASDNLWGGATWLSALLIDMYRVNLSVTDLTAEIHYLQPIESYFTTEGPLLVNHYEIPQEIENAFNLKLHLINKDLVNSAINVKAALSSSDTNVVNVDFNYQSFGTIDPGQIKNSAGGSNVYTQNNPDSIKFNVDIFSNGILYWSDTITVKIHLNVNDVEDVASGFPTEFAFEQNYPNPFNPSTKIKYSIQENSFVNLKVFDVLGREVAILVNEQQKAGYYEVNFNASYLKSGVYFYKINAGSFVETKKMVLLK